MNDVAMHDGLPAEECENLALKCRNLPSGKCSGLTTLENASASAIPGLGSRPRLLELEQDRIELFEERARWRSSGVRGSRPVEFARQAQGRKS
jgi:hypothetical protein